MKKSLSFKNFRSSSESASRAQARIRSSETQGEQLIRSELWKLGFRFRKNVKTLPGRPDIVFVRQRLAIFCDGDFWHGRRWSKDKIRLRAGPNPSYWVQKIQTNISRDRKRNRELRRLGWKVLRVWESDVRMNSKLAAKRIIQAAASSSRPSNDRLGRLKMR